MKNMTSNYKNHEVKLNTSWPPKPDNAIAMASHNQNMNKKKILKESRGLDAQGSF